MEYASKGDLSSIIKKKTKESKNKLNIKDNYSNNIKDNTDLTNSSKSNYLSKFLPEIQIVEILTQLANGLNYLHRKKILHRDIKPQNIFLFENNIVRSYYLN